MKAVIPLKKKKKERQETTPTARTCRLLNVGESPHGELLSVVRLAGVAGSWTDALIAQPAQVGNIQLLTATVSPQLSANPFMELFCKSLETQSPKGA